MNNIKIVPGNPIPSHDAYRTNCQFDYKEFKNMEVFTFKSDPESSLTGKEKLRKAMTGKQSILWIKNIGQTGGLSDGDTEIMGNKEKADYNDVPCCVLTSYGTLVPQVIVPTKNVVDNGMSYSDGITTQISQLPRSEKGGYVWKATKLSASEYSGSPEKINECISSQLTYGERVPMFKCATNEHSGKKYVDNPAFTTRKYTCDTDEGPAGTGACAICYKIIEYTEIGVGKDTTEQEQAPQIKVQLAGKMDVIGVSSQVNTIGATIAKSGQMIGVCGENIGQGSMPEPSSDIMPPQCTKTGDQYDMYPLFMYPLYNGFVMTNSVIGNLQNGSGTIFIKYDDTIQNPIYTAELGGVHKSTDMEALDEVDDTSELMKWFPTLYQESHNKNGIRIKVPRSEKINFNDRISVDFYKCLGRFAYCPIYFHRKIQFTMYFKGEYKDPEKPSKTYGKYRFYPLVCANIGEDTADAWTGINGDGSDCITEVRYVTSDDDLQESIYAVDFEFEASSLQRYPIEIFGTVVVYERSDFQFSVENGNGEFIFDQPILPTFSKFLLKQNELEVGKKFLSLISNLSVSASLDGVSGSMTLDGYPLAQGIQVFRQDQSVGELDLSIEYDLTEDSIPSSSSTVEPLFSGFALELSTNDGENGYNIGVNLSGINRKLEDMKLICAPFWDGDRLEMICAYFEEYAKIQIKMIDHTVTSYNYHGLPGEKLPKVVDTYPHSNKGTWLSDTKTIINNTEIANSAFRVPRSCDWRAPAVNFSTGTSVLEALKKLGEMTGCVCVPQIDGTITYYELNNFGIPFYVDNQINIVEFEPTDIISISMQPQLQNKYNSIATFGFLQRKNAEGKILAEENVQHGAFYSKTNGGGLEDVGVQIPWSRQSVGVESAMFTKMELAEVHANRVKMMTADIYLGNLTVRGNTRVNHIYQKIKACGQEYFVLSIEHSVEASTKVWTTSYQLQYISMTNENA